MNGNALKFRRSVEKHSVVGLDTAPFIYFIEDVVPYAVCFLVFAFFSQSQCSIVALPFTPYRITFPALASTFGGIITPKLSARFDSYHIVV